MIILYIYIYDISTVCQIYHIFMYDLCYIMCVTMIQYDSLYCPSGSEDSAAKNGPYDSTAWCIKVPYYHG